MTNVTPFHRNGQYTDIRVAIRDILDKNPDSSKGIVVLFDEQGMHKAFVCNSSQLAFAAADMLYTSATNGDEVID